MTWPEVVLVLGYASLLLEITVFPIPSEASSWQLFAPASASAAAGPRLLAVRAQPRWRLLVGWLVPTVVGVVVFLLPLATVFLPAVRTWLLPIGDPGTGWPWSGLAVFGCGRALTFSSVLQLRRQRRRGGTAPIGWFRRSRNPGLVGMGLCWLGLCLWQPAWLLFCAAPLWAWNMHRRVLLEEDHLSARLGADYVAYRNTVPRYFL